MSEPRRCPYCGEVVTSKYRCPCRSVEIVGPRVDPAVSQEASRLHDNLGYSWDQAFAAAEIMVLVRERGFVAVPVEDLMGDAA